MWQELTTERIVAEADLKKQLGTLRYLQGLKAARQRLAAAAQGADPFATCLALAACSARACALLTASLMTAYACLPCRWPGGRLAHGQRASAL